MIIKYEDRKQWIKNYVLDEDITFNHEDNFILEFAHVINCSVGTARNLARKILNELEEECFILVGHISMEGVNGAWRDYNLYYTQK